MTTSPAEEEKKAIEKQSEAELREIAECLMDIRRRTGFGYVLIDLRNGEIVELEVTYKRRPKTESKSRVI